MGSKPTPAPAPAPCTCTALETCACTCTFYLCCLCLCAVCGRHITVPYRLILTAAGMGTFTHAPFHVSPGNVHLCTFSGDYPTSTTTNPLTHYFSITVASYGPRVGPRGRGRPRRVGGRAGWPRSARTRRCRRAGHAGSCLLGRSQRPGSLLQAKATAVRQLMGEHPPMLFSVLFCSGSQLCVLGEGETHSYVSALTGSRRARQTGPWVFVLACNVCKCDAL